MGRKKILSILKGLRPQSLPRGEIWATPEVLGGLGWPNNVEGVINLAVEIDADFCFLGCRGFQPLPCDIRALTEAVELVHFRELACGAVVDGPWQRLQNDKGLFQLLHQLAKSVDEVRRELQAQFPYVRRELEAWIEAGADFILLADDLAYGGGIYFNPLLFDDILAPGYRQFVHIAGRRPTAIGFHSDGNIMLLFSRLVKTGFSFFSLEPEAMNLAKIWRKYYPKNIILLSGIYASWLIPDNLKETTEIFFPSEFVAIAKDGGLILASSCGLYDPASVEALKDIYRTADSIFKK